MVSLAQRAAFAADTLTEEDVAAMRGWYNRIKKQQKDIIPHKNCEKIAKFFPKTPQNR